MEEAPNAPANRVQPGSELLRAEIDTSAPFESVKEAVTRFGGLGYWKPVLTAHNHNSLTAPQELHQKEELDTGRLEEQAGMLEKELILKERETLDVLKELESTKKLVENLKSKLQESEANLNIKMTLCDNKENGNVEDEKENQVSHVLQPSKEGCIPRPSTAPGLILMELKKAKLNLNRTTNDIAEVRASVESLNSKLEKERTSLEKTRERLTQNCLKITSLEEELNQTRQKLQVAKEAEIKGDLDDNPSDIAREVRRLSSEEEHFKKLGEAAKSEVLRAMSEIEHTKAMIRTAEIRLVAARKMKEAARAAEASALAEIKVLSHDESSDCDGVTLSFEEYTALTYKAHEAEERSKKRVFDAMLQVDEANFSKLDILKRVEEAAEEVKISKKALEEALEKVEAANRGKLAVEAALWNWRSNSHKRRTSMHFKNSHPSHRRRDSRSLDVSAMNLVNDEGRTSLQPTLSIGQILSRKLMLPGEFESGTMLRGRRSVKRNVSLGQMLGKQNNDPYFERQVEKENGQKLFCAKRKKFGFGRFSHLLSKQQKKKQPTLNLR